VKKETPVRKIRQKLGKSEKVPDRRLAPLVRVVKESKGKGWASTRDCSSRVMKKEEKNRARVSEVGKHQKKAKVFSVTTV